MNKAALAAQKVVDLYLGFNPGACLVFGPTRKLYEQVVMLGHLFSNSRPPFQLPAFKEEFAADYKGQFNAIIEALADHPRVTLNAVEGAPDAAGEKPVYLHLSVGPSGIHTGEISSAIFGIPHLFPPQFVAALANYGHEWTSGNELIPIAGLEHTVTGEQEVWARLLERSTTQVNNA